VFAVEAEHRWCRRGLEVQDRRSVDDDPRSTSAVREECDPAPVVAERRWEPRIQTAQLVSGPVIDSDDEAPFSPTDPGNMTLVGTEHDRHAIE
jgi:hypothetical protein